MQDIKLTRISQRVSERLYNLLAVGESGRCPSRGHRSKLLSWRSRLGQHQQPVMIYFCLAASKIRFVIVSGCDMREPWLAFTSIVLAPMRFAMKRWRFGGYLKQKAAKILIQRLPVRTPTPNGGARKSPHRRA